MRNGKYIIGLTGNIATGKSTVARMLERLGAKVIDADRLVHWLLNKDESLKKDIVKEFGSDILGEDGRIVRKRLAAKVFGKPQALRRLEELIHPKVVRLVQWLIDRAEEDVIVVEAIKLIESGMHKYCDALWVVHCSRSEQVRRLIEYRGMSPYDALLRVRAQPPQEEKLAQADVVIDNEGDLRATWEQVRDEWEKVLREVQARKAAKPAAPLGKPAPTMPKPAPEAAKPAAEAPRPTIEVSARKATRQDVEALARVMSEASGREVSSQEALMKLLEMGYVLGIAEERPVGAVGWLAENLVASIEEVLIVPGVPAEAVLPPMLDAMEAEARTLLCEVAMVALPPGDSLADVYARCGYERMDSTEGLFRAWREEATRLLESREGATLYLKRLREELITKPV